MAGRHWGSGTKNPRWTPEEIQVLKDMTLAGKGYDEIAAKLGKTRSAVAGKLSNYRAVLKLPYKK